MNEHTVSRHEVTSHPVDRLNEQFSKTYSSEFLC